MDFDILGWWTKVGFGSSDRLRVNCWFCNGNFEIESKFKNQWTCPSCEQYNGFAEDGNYNKPISLIFERKQEKTTQSWEKSPVADSPSILCHSCNQNQILKVRQLASFVPLDETVYDEEISSYQRYLEHIYNLCNSCYWKVKDHLKNLHQRLEVGHVESEEQRVDKSFYSLKSNKRFTRDSSPLSFLPLTLFSLSCALSLCLALLQLRSLLESRYRSGGGILHLIYSHLDSLLYAVPVKNITHLEQGLIYAGATCCILGLATVGKFSLCLVDAVHILLWLFSLLAWVVVPSVFLDSAQSERFPSIQTNFVFVSTKLFLSVATSLAAFVCIFKTRQDSNISTLRIFMKPVLADSNKCSESEPEMEDNSQINLKPSLGKEEEDDVSCSSFSSPSFVGDASNRFMPIRSHSSHLRPGSPALVSSVWHSPSSSESVPSRKVSKTMLSDRAFPSDSEGVRQNLETFSLGLGKKSGSSSSSIWSLPSIVTSSPCHSPDTTTQKSSRQSPLNRRVLSPSRLGFLTCDSPPATFASYHASVPSDASQWRDSHVKDSCQDFEVFHNISQNEFPASSYQKSPELKSDRRIQCDSSTNLGVRQQNGRERKMESEAHSLNDDHFDPPDSSSSLSNGKKQLRRSNRIAMQGRIIKPWPLKKSFSLNSMYDRKNAEVAGRLAREESQQNFVSKMKMTDEELNFSGFKSYRPMHAQRHPDSLSNSGSECGFSSPKDYGGYSLRRVPRKILEYSEDEEEREEDELIKDRLWRKKSRRTTSFTNTIRDSWITWMLVLFGVVIGISITFNAFFLWTVLNKSGV